MEKPQKFFHVDRTRVSSWDGYSYKYAFHVGRVELSGSAVAVIVVILSLLIIITQIAVGAATGWTVWWPALIIAAIGALAILYNLVMVLVYFFQWLAGEITVHGPNEKGSSR